MSSRLASVTRLPTRYNPDLPPCGNAWDPGQCPEGGPHLCWTWQGWPHICRCMRCHYRGNDTRIRLARPARNTIDFQRAGLL